MTALRTTFAAAALFALAFHPAYAQTQAPTRGKPDLARADRQAIENLAQSDMAEVQAGKLGAQKATHPEVKKFAQHMADEHGKFLEAGRSLAQSKGVKFPTEPERKQKSMLKDMQDWKADEFDRKFMDKMVDAHEDALKVAQKAVKDAKDPDVRAHAEKAAPAIREHLAQARQLKDAVRNDSGSGNAGRDAGGAGTSNRDRPASR
jgi:putative membrane protein